MNLKVQDCKQSAFLVIRQVIYLETKKSRLWCFVHYSCRGFIKFGRSSGIKSVCLGVKRATSTHSNPAILHIHTLGSLISLVDILFSVLASLAGSRSRWIQCAAALRLQSDSCWAWCYCKMSCGEMLAYNCKLGVFVGCVYSGRQLHLSRANMRWTARRRSPFNDYGKLCDWLNGFGAHFLHGQPPCQECSRWN